jgi:hypothetical protein
MFFNFKKKPIVIHAVTDRADILEFSKIDLAQKFYPEWLLNMPGVVDSELTDFTKPIFNNHSVRSYATIKRCTGINNIFTNGLIMPLWSDFIVDLDKVGNENLFYEFSDKITKITRHSPRQFNYQLPNTITQLKIQSPWNLHCDEDIKFLWTEPTWNLNLDNILDIKILPAIIDFKYQSNTAVNLFIQRKEQTYRIKIPFGTPITHIVPLSDRKIKIEYHLLSSEEFLRFKSKKGLIQQTFVGRYNMNKKIAKTNKCPFNFNK